MDFTLFSFLFFEPIVFMLFIYTWNAGRYILKTLRILFFFFFTTVWFLSFKPAIWKVGYLDFGRMGKWYEITSKSTVYIWTLFTSSFDFWNVNFWLTRNLTFTKPIINKCNSYFCSVEVIIKMSQNLSLKNLQGISWEKLEEYKAQFIVPDQKWKEVTKWR